MMDQINILGNSRDYSSSENEKNKKEDKKVKLTEKSKKNIEMKNKFLFSNAMKHMQTSLNYEEKADKIEDKLADQTKLSLEESAILNMQLVSLRSMQYHYSDKAVKSYNKAIAVKKFMKENITDKFKKFCLKTAEKIKSFAEKLDVTDVNVPNVAKLFENDNDKSNETHVGIDLSALDEEIKKSKEELGKQSSDIVEEKEPIENSASLYSYKKDDIVQDSIYSEDSSNSLSEKNNTTDNEAKSNTEDSAINVPFSKFEGNSISSENPVSIPFEDFEKNLSSISENIDNESYTINDLEALRNAIEQERKTQEELKNRLESQRIEKENAEKEAMEAEKEKEAKIKFANEQLAAYRAENQKLKNQQIEVEQETQRKLSARQAAMNQIAEINQMLAGGNLDNNLVVTNRRGK